jgi:hypothetical protein
MPSVFKSLATLTAWILFIFGLASLIGGVFRIVQRSDLVGFYLGFGILSLVLFVVVARIRQTMG